MASCTDSNRYLTIAHRQGQEDPAEAGHYGVTIFEQLT
jgi:hypothetical protein